jgi:hypothetical protein
LHIFFISATIETVENFEMSDHDEKQKGKLRIGERKKVGSYAEEVKMKTLAQRSKKTRLLRQLKKNVEQLQILTFEPVEAIFVLKELKTKNFKYFGYGDLVTRFQNGNPLSSGKPNKSRISKVFDTTQVDPPERWKCTFSFVTGAGSSSLKKGQRNTLDKVQVDNTDVQTIR